MSSGVQQHSFGYGQEQMYRGQENYNFQNFQQGQTTVDVHGNARACLGKGSFSEKQRLNSFDRMGGGPHAQNGYPEAASRTYSYDRVPSMDASNIAAAFARDREESFDAYGAQEWLRRESFSSVRSGQMNGRDSSRCGNGSFSGGSTRCNTMSRDNSFVNDSVGGRSRASSGSISEGPDLWDRPPSSRPMTSREQIVLSQQIPQDSRPSTSREQILQDSRSSPEVHRRHQEPRARGYGYDRDDERKLRDRPRKHRASPPQRPTSIADELFQAIVDAFSCKRPADDDDFFDVELI